MLSAIVAIARNGVIGKDNGLPWHYPEDLRYFKEKTQGHTVVMGRNTYESILSSLKKPLPNRKSVLLTRQPENYSDVECYSSVEDFLQMYKDSKEEIFVIGGATIYREFLPFLDRLYITWIERDVEGDTTFPGFNLDEYQLLEERTSGELRFCVYERMVR